eukprot:7318570-Alexandrium_andersonii.AAC.1
MTHADGDDAKGQLAQLEEAHRAVIAAGQDSMARDLDVKIGKLKPKGPTETQLCKSYGAASE